MRGLARPLAVFVLGSFGAIAVAGGCGVEPNRNDGEDVEESSEAITVDASSSSCRHARVVARTRAGDRDAPCDRDPDPRDWERNWRERLQGHGQGYLHFDRPFTFALPRTIPVEVHPGTRHLVQLEVVRSRQPTVRCLYFGGPFVERGRAAILIGCTHGARAGSLLTADDIELDIVGRAPATATFEVDEVNCQDAGVDASIDGSTGGGGDSGTSDASVDSGPTCDPTNCAPRSACERAACVSGTCTRGAAADGTACNADNNACTVGDACLLGVCTAGTPVTIPTAPACQVASCDATTGAIVFSPAADGSSCDDGNACTQGDHCAAGACVGGGAKQCTATSACSIASCDTTQGCIETPRPAGTSCETDGDVCNGVSVCDGAGTCRPGTPVTCTPTNACMAATCDRTQGCVQTPVTGCDPTPTRDEVPFEMHASLLGKLIDATGAPLRNATFTVYENRTDTTPRNDVSVTSASDGSFRVRLEQFPTIEPDRTPPHRLLVRIETPSTLRAMREAYVHPGDAVDLGVIKLVTRDSKITNIGPEGGTATDSRGQFQIEIPPGALTTTVPVQITPFQNRDEFPTPLPSETVTMYGVALEPDGTHFATPAKMKVSNTRNLPTTLQIPVGEVDETVGVWRHIGIATWNGTRFEVPIQHFSFKDVNGADESDLIASWGHPRDPNDGKPQCGAGSTWSPMGGSFGQRFELPSVRVRGESFAPTFHYDSGLAGTRKLGREATSSAAVPHGSLGVSVAAGKVSFSCVAHGGDPPSTGASGQCSARVGSCGPSAQTMVRGQFGMLGAQGDISQSITSQVEEMDLGAWLQVPFGDDGQSVVTPNYVTQTLRLAGGGSGTCTGSGGTFGAVDLTGPRVQLAQDDDAPFLDIERRVFVNHRFASPYGAGWAVANIDRVFFDANGDDATLLHGDGVHELFAPRASLAYLDFFDTMAFARDPNTGEIFAASSGTIERYDAASGTRTALLTGLPFDRSIHGIAVAYVGGARHFLVATASSLLDVAGNGSTRTLAARSNPFPGANGFFGQASVAAFGDVVAYTSGREDDTTIEWLHLGDAAPALAHLSKADGGDIDLRPQGPISEITFASPRGLAFAPDGTLYFAEPRRNVVYHVTLDAGGSIGPGSHVELVVGRGSGTSIAPVGERHPGARFGINQPARLSVGEDGMVLVLGSSGIVEYDPIAKEAETLVLDKRYGGEIEETLTGPYPISLLALSSTSLLSQGSAGPFRIEIEPSSSERDPTRTLRRVAGGGFELRDTTQALVWRFDASGREVEQRKRTGELDFTVAYVDGRGDRIDRVTNAVGGAWVFNYTSGKLAGVTDPAGRTTSVEVDSRGDLVRLILPDSEAHAFTYDAHHMTEKRMPSGDRTTYAYKDDGTAASSQKPAGEQQTFDAALSHDSTYENGKLVSTASRVDAHGVRHDITTNGFGDAEHDVWTADGVTYDRALVYATRLKDFDNSLRFDGRANAMKRVSRETLNGVPLGSERFFDNTGRVYKESTQKGQTTEIGYDANGWVSRFRSFPSSAVQQITRDPAGHIASIADFVTGTPTGRSAAFTWRADGLVATATIHGVTTTYRYGADGNPVEETDTTGRDTNFGLDGRGNVTSVSDGTASASFAFDQNDRLVRATDGFGNATTYRYTRADCGCSEGDLVTAIHTPDLPVDVVWGFDYGPEGRLTGVTDPAGFKETYAYRATGELSSVLDRNQHKTTWSYDSLGRAIGQLDALGRRQARSYPVPSGGAWQGSAIAGSSGDGSAASTSLSGSLASGASQIGLNAFDTEGYPARVELYRDATFELAFSRTFDVAGRQAQKRDRIGEPISSTAAFGSSASGFIWDSGQSWNLNTSASVLTGGYATTPSGTENYGIGQNADFDDVSTGGFGGVAEAFLKEDITRDTAGRVTQLSRRFRSTASPAAYGIVSTYAYRPDGRMSQVVNPDGQHDFTYDARGQLETQTVLGEGVYRYGYDALGRNDSLTYPDGHTRTQIFDRVGRLTSRCYDYAGTQRCYTATYDAGGNPIRMTDPEGVDVFEYDALDRLTRATRYRPDGVTELGVEAYAYNGLGALRVNAGVAVDHQRPRLDGAGLADAAVPATLDGRPVTLDKGGFVTKAADVSFEFSRAGYLKGATPTSGTNSVYAVDARQRRVIRQFGPSDAPTDVEFYVYEGVQRVAVLDGAGTTRESVLFDGIDHPLRLARGASTSYFELDLAGNVRALRSFGGADLGHYRYSAFGKTVEDTVTPNVDQAVRWKGRPREVIRGLELYDMRARQWVPALGVFIAIDDYRYATATTTLWGWPGQNPFRWADPSGHLLAPLVPLAPLAPEAAPLVVTPTGLGLATFAVYVELGFQLYGLYQDLNPDIIQGGQSCSISGGGNGGGGPPVPPSARSFGGGPSDAGAEGGARPTDPFARISQLPQGRQAQVRTVSTEAELQDIFDDLSDGGTEITNTSYPGKLVRLADGTRVGLRAQSSSGGATIDIFRANYGIAKIHIAP